MIKTTLFDEAAMQTIAGNGSMGHRSMGQMQCRINANRGPWQLFARGPLLTRDKMSKTNLNFYFFVAKVMSNYLYTDGLKKIFSTSGGPPEA